MIHLHRIVFGTGGEHGPHTQVIGPLLLGQQRLLHSLGRYADNLVLPQNGTHIPGFHIALSHMDSVRSDFSGDFHIVIDHKGNAMPAAERLNLPGLCQKGFLIQLFFP